MVESRRVVIGSFTNRNDAISEIKRLKEDGYQRDEITLYTNADNLDALKDSQEVDVATETTVEGTTDGDNRSFWEQVKDAFSTEAYDHETVSQEPNYNRDKDILFPYRSDIEQGNIVVVVENYRGDVNLDRTEATANTAAGMDNRTENEKIRLKEERLEVDKEKVETGEVNVKKETVHDTETVEVPVEREEVVIEKKPVVGEDAKTTDTTIDEESESYTIPVKEEKVEVDKKPVVTEEVEIRKETHDDVEQVTEDVKREEIDVDAEGQTGMDGTPKNKRNKR